jgi:hypothetical protein
MAERHDLLGSIAATIKDYRAGEIPQPTPQHVDRWISQFGGAVQVPMLREMQHVLSQTYFAETDVRTIFESLIDDKKVAGDPPCQFWRTAHLFDIQEHGHSQAEVRKFFGTALKARCGLDIDTCGSDGGPFVYLDDALFSGGRVGEDLTAWIEGDAPANGIVHVIVIVGHRLGEYLCKRRLREVAAGQGKDLTFSFWASVWFENRKACKDTSVVLWPATLPEDTELSAYMAEERKFPFEPRHPGGRVEPAIFSSEEGRQLLEREFLLAGVRIRNACQNPSRAMRPLGFSAFGLGFGSLIATFRNCPNNTPLALWWGDADASLGHPFRSWYPLLPRKTYAQETELDALPL